MEAPVKLRLGGLGRNAADAHEDGERFWEVGITTRDGLNQAARICITPIEEDPEDVEDEREVGGGMPVGLGSVHFGEVLEEGVDVAERHEGSDGLHDGFRCRRAAGVKRGDPDYANPFGVSAKNSSGGHSYL